jgi:hypothetical protein
VYDAFIINEQGERITMIYTENPMIAVRVEVKPEEALAVASILRAEADRHYEQARLRTRIDEELWEFAADLDKAAEVYENAGAEGRDFVTIHALPEVVNGIAWVLCHRLTVATDKVWPIYKEASEQPTDTNPLGINFGW